MEGLTAVISKKTRRRPTLPRGFPRSTIGSGGLNFRVRDGNGCDPSDIATGNSSSIAALIKRAMRAYEGKIDFWLRSDSLGRAFCFTRVPRPDLEPRTP